MRTIASANTESSVALEHRFGLGAGAGLSIPTYGQTFRDHASTGWSGEVHADYYLSNAFGLRLDYYRLNYKSSSPVGKTFNLGGFYRFMDTAILTPVIGAGVGYANTSGNENSGLNYNNIIFNGKIGLDYSICKNWVLELAAKYDFLFAKGDGTFDEHGLVPEVNFTYFFSATAKAPTPEPAPAALPAASAPTVAKDQRCHDIPAGTPVNSLGCPINEKIDFTLGVQFDSGKSVVKSQYHQELSEMAALLKAHTDLNAEIQGYTDNSGDKNKNIKLSSTRALAVKNYLVKKLGVNASQLTSKGYGPDSPIADNTSAEGRTRNRRVVASLHSK